MFVEKREEPRESVCLPAFVPPCTRNRIEIREKVRLSLDLMISRHAHAFTKRGQNHQNRLYHIEQTDTQGVNWSSKNTIWAHRTNTDHRSTNQRGFQQILGQTTKIAILVWKSIQGHRAKLEHTERSNRAGTACWQSFMANGRIKGHRNHQNRLCSIKTRFWSKTQGLQEKNLVSDLLMMADMTRTRMVNMSHKMTSRRQNSTKIAPSVEQLERWLYEQDMGSWSTSSRHQAGKVSWELDDQKVPKMPKIAY